MITFQNEGKILKGQKQQIKASIKTIAHDFGKKLGSVNYVFMSDEELLKVNQDVLKHDYYTDIITFDYSENNKIDCEILISLDRVRENSAKFAQPFSTELLRVMLHGILHVVGFRDKSKNEKEEMRKMENQYIKKHNTLFHVERPYGKQV